MTATASTLGYKIGSYGPYAYPALLYFERQSGDPGADGGFSAATVTSHDGTPMTVDRQSKDFSVRIQLITRYSYLGSLTYNLEYDITNLTSGVADLDKLVLMKRASSGQPWTPFDTTRAGMTLQAALGAFPWMAVLPAHGQ